MADATAIGIDIGGTHIRAARIAGGGEVLAWIKRPTSPEPSLVVAEIGELVRALDAPGVAGVGIGVPGRVDVGRGRVLSGGYVDLSGLSLADLAGGAIKRPVFVDNDGNMAVTAECAVGNGRSAGTVVMFTIGTGIGGGVVMDGKVLRGRAAAGQLGHITVDGNGRPCLCGRRGCVETTSSGTALRHHIAAAGLPPAVSVEMLLVQAAANDPAAKAILAAWAAPMRSAIDTAVAAFDPDVVILGGGLGAAMHRALDEYPAAGPWYRCALAPAALGDRAGVIGAGLRALAEVKEPAAAAS